MNPYDTEEFRNFLKSDCDRYGWICDWLNAHEIGFSTLPAGKQKLIAVEFSNGNYDENYRLKTILAHYDRIKIGANDNSSTVWLLLNWILRLKENYGTDKAHNMYIIFTDGEELGVGNSSENPGVLGTAAVLKNSELASGDVFALDSCGRGDTVVVSSAGRNNGSLKFQDEFKDLYDRTIETARHACDENWLTMPTFYGDNAGCILVGIPAVAVTVLPRNEAVKYMRSLQKFPDLYEKMMNHDLTEEERNALPPTWQMMHTDDDSIENLTSESWPLMFKFLDGLARMKSR